MTARRNKRRKVNCKRKRRNTKEKEIKKKQPRRKR